MATRNRYQNGSVERVKRAKGPDVWIFRWRELQPNGSRVQRKKVVGDVHRLPNLSAAKKAVENLRAEVNAKNDQVGEPIAEKLTVGQLWGLFQTERFLTGDATGVEESKAEPDDLDVEPDEDSLSPSTIQNYKDNFRLYILPKWNAVPIEEVKPYAVQKWLRSLKATKKTPARPGSKTMVEKRLAPGTKSKIRNQMSALFSFAILHDLWPDKKRNPIEPVKQSAKRRREPDVLKLGEVRALLAELPEAIHRTAIYIAAAAALRRSELRGLKWSDIDFEEGWLHVRRGVIQRKHSRAKTEASRRGIPLQPELAEVLCEWRKETAYPNDDDWVLASPDGDGQNPLWLDTVLQRYIQPAARRAGIEKQIGWHTFRHSLGYLLAAKKEHVKVAQELLRHANPRITMAIYQQADNDAKRAAQGHLTELFIVPKAKVG